MTRFGQVLVVLLSVCVLADSASAGLVARWSFDEGAGDTAIDSVGGFNGSLEGDSQLEASDGVSGGRLDSGDDGFVRVGNVLDFGGDDAMTVQAWIKTTQSTGALVLGRHVSGFLNGYFLALNDVNDGSPNEPAGSMHLYQSDNPQFHSGIQGLNDGEWHQVVAVRDAGTPQHVRLYVDGERVPGPGSVGPLNPLLATAGEFLIAGATFGTEQGSTYVGYLDEVRVWNSALSDEKVKFFFEHPDSANPVLCGDVNLSGDHSASDALGALRAAVGTADALDCIADVNDNKEISATDALQILRKSVGLSAALDCPPCIGEELLGLRLELPCQNEATPVCSAAATTSTAGSLRGDNETTYDVRLRIRGVVEQKSYVGGMQDGYFLAGGAPAADGYNVISLTTFSPAATYHLNAGTSSIQRVWPVDMTHTISMRGGSSLLLRSESIDNLQIANTDGTGTPVVPPGVPPAPAAFPGQFLQIDVVSIEPQD